MHLDSCGWMALMNGFDSSGCSVGAAVVHHNQQVIGKFLNEAADDLSDSTMMVIDGQHNSEFISAL